MEQYIQDKVKELVDFYWKLREDVDYEKDEKKKERIIIAMNFIEVEFMQLEEDMRDIKRRALEILSGKRIDNG